MKQQETTRLCSNCQKRPASTCTPCIEKRLKKLDELVRKMQQQVLVLTAERSFTQEMLKAMRKKAIARMSQKKAA